ncbi:MAG: hypothetical protein BWY67_01450 [Bacteroidetes bacterium ADurb.Bin397]|nr:MAG: hypothetical protein BWY67_01450 [Bacteroidetes bacterium ADurb.Bin397]
MSGAYQFVKGLCPPQAVRIAALVRFEKSKVETLVTEL